MTLIIAEQTVKISATAAKMIKNIANGKHFVATQSDVPTLRRLVDKGLVQLRDYEGKVLMGLTKSGINAAAQIR